MRVIWQQLESAPATQIPILVERLRESGQVSVSVRPDDARSDASGRFRLNVARLAIAVAPDADHEWFTATLAQFLDHIPSAGYDEIAGAVQALESTAAVAWITPAVTARLTDESGSSVARLKFAAVIAGLAPDRLALLDLSDKIAKWLTECSAEELALRLPLFDRVGATQLVTSLRTQMTSAELPHETQTNAARALTRFLSNDADQLTGLVTEADEDELAMIAIALQSIRSDAVRQLRQRFDDIHAQPRVVPTDDLAPPTNNDVQASRLAIALWLLGDTAAVRESLRHDPDPTLQTLVIHGLAQQAVTVESLVTAIRGVQSQHDEPSTALKFGLLQTLGLLPAKQVRAGVTATWLNELWQNDPDSGVHSTVGWLAKRLEYDLPNPPPGEHGHWLVDQSDEFGQTLTIVEPHTAELGIHNPKQAPVLTTPWPRHKRRFPRRFAIATHEVTIAQFRRFNTEYRAEHVIPSTSARDAAMTLVSRNEAYRFCNWCSDQLGLEHCYEMKSGSTTLTPKENHLTLTGYRLPTDAEWESAC